MFKGFQEQLLLISSPTKSLKNGSFYITKIGQDFYYKGKIKQLSVNSDWYKVFCALHDLLPEGGEIGYKEIIAEVKSRIPKTKSRTEEKMRRFIQSNLTDKINGFVRYAGIAGTEDSGKPLIRILRNTGVQFNNAMK